MCAVAVSDAVDLDGCATDREEACRGDGVVIPADSSFGAPDHQAKDSRDYRERCENAC